jgi:hypothetical protein
LRSKGHTHTDTHEVAEKVRGRSKWKAEVLRRKKRSSSSKRGAESLFLYGTGGLQVFRYLQRSPISLYFNTKALQIFKGTLVDPCQFEYFSILVFSHFVNLVRFVDCRFTSSLSCVRSVVVVVYGSVCAYDLYGSLPSLLLPPIYSVQTTHGLLV